MIFKSGLDSYHKCCLLFQSPPILITSTNGELMSTFWLMWKDTNKNISNLENICDLELLLKFQLVYNVVQGNFNLNIHG